MSTKAIENVVVVTPHVQMIGRDAACVTYVRVVQILDMYVMDHMSTSHDPHHYCRSGNYSTQSHADTVIWKYSTTGGGWKCTHYHTT